MNVVAKRARKISAEYEERQEVLDEKAVSIAIDEVYAGKLTINRDEKSKETAEAEEEEVAIMEEEGEE